MVACGNLQVPGEPSACGVPSCWRFVAPRPDLTLMPLVPAVGVRGASLHSVRLVAAGLPGRHPTLNAQQPDAPGRSVWLLPSKFADADGDHCSASLALTRSTHCQSTKRSSSRLSSTGKKWPTTSGLP